MARLIIYLANDLEQCASKAAKAAGLSVSKWVADRVTESVTKSWPPEFLALAGAFPDFPDAAELRKGYGEHAPAESGGA